MSAQPFDATDIELMREDHADCVDESCHNRDRRWLATVDSLTSRLDAATRENARLVKCVKDEWDGEAADKILTNVEELAAALDAATRRADEVGALLREARDAMRALYNDVADERLWDVDATVAKFRKIISRIDAALSTGSTPATTGANPGDKAARIDAAKSDGVAP